MKQKKTKIIIALSLAVAMAVGVGFYLRTRPKEVTNYDKQAEFEADQEKPENEPQAGGVEAGIQIPGYKSITIAAGTKDVSVELMNPEENNVYFEISFYLPETNETLYTSKLIKPGQYLYDITLEREMEAGGLSGTIMRGGHRAGGVMVARKGAVGQYQ